MVDFNQSFTYLMTNEGGGEYVDNPNDSGGPTKWGVSLRFLRNLKKDQTLTEDAIKNLTYLDALSIAQAEFWVPLGCDKAISQSCATAILDMGYLEGVHSCGLIVQAVLKTLGHPIDLDGVLGSRSWEYINTTDCGAFINALVSVQLDHYERLVAIHPEDVANLNGWINRAKRLLTLQAVV